MSFLADTHALLWWLLGDKRLSASARDVLSTGSHVVYVSAASAWEITTKHRRGKLPEADRFAADVEARVVSEGFMPLPVTMAHAQLAGRLDGAHRDPFDSMLIAQALIENLTLISNDAAFRAFPISRLW